MTRIDATSWSGSLRALFGEGMFAAVGARRCDDWRLDALDVMQLRTDDRRGWSKVAAASGGGNYGTGPDSPFSAVAPADFSTACPVSRRGAHTNAATARWNPHADMFRREGAYEGFTSHVTDCGVIALSAKEVGIFWGFSID